MTAASPALRHWVDMSLECVRRDHTTTISIGDQRGPFLSGCALGMALAALHDARATALGQTPFLAATPPPGLVGADETLAGAAACHQLLRERFPKQAMLLDASWRDWCELHPIADPTHTAEMAGRNFGLSIHMLGLDDPGHAAKNQYTLPDPPLPDYLHRIPAHEPMQGYSGANWGEANHLMLGPTHTPSRNRP